MNTRIAFLLIAFVLGSTTLCGAADLPATEGVFGLEEIPAQTYLALWVPVAEGSVVSGVQWYHNDSQTVIPEIVAQAGVLDWPSSVTGAVVVAQNISGGSQEWSEVEFDPVITSDCGGLYLYFQLPSGDGFESAGFGGGFGIGYCVGSGVRSSWLTQDGESWNPMSVDYRIAAQAVVQPNKAKQDAVVLHLPDSLTSTAETAQHDAPIAAEPGLHASPNPFNPSTLIKFATSAAGPVKLGIYDLRGHRVVELMHGAMEQGDHAVSWDGRSQNGRPCATGVYFVRLETVDGTMSDRIVLLK